MLPELYLVGFLLKNYGYLHHLGPFDVLVVLCGKVVK